MTSPSSTTGPSTTGEDGLSDPAEQAFTALRIGFTAAPILFGTVGGGVRPVRRGEREPTVTATVATTTIASAAGDVTSHRRPVDIDQAVDAASDLLDALGIDRTAPGLERTPARMAGMFAELLSSEPFSATTFLNDGGYDELVVVTDIPFTSLCEHHLLPFRGVAHVGYLPGERIVGLSKLARLVEAFSRRPQTQERMTTQVADWLDDHLAPKGTGVVLEAEHLCMSIRGVRATGARTVTSRLCGQLRERTATRAEFLHLTGTSRTTGTA